MAVPKSELYRQRIEQLVELAFAGSQRAMAQRLGVSAGLISRVVAGLVTPSKKLLQAIEKLPQVNSTWLHTGKGKPLHMQPQVLTDLGAIVPLAKRLLTKPLLESEDLLSHRFISVPRAFYSLTTYAIQLKSCHCDQIFLTKEFLKLEDTLIIETSPDRLREVARLDSDKLRVMHSAEYGAALAASASDFFRITRGSHQSKDDNDDVNTQGGRKSRALILDVDDIDLNQNETRGKLMTVRDQDESPTVAGVVTLSMREYRVE